MTSITIQTQMPRQRTCGICGATGHDRRTCPNNRGRGFATPTRRARIIRRPRVREAPAVTTTQPSIFAGLPPVGANPTAPIANPMLSIINEDSLDVLDHRELAMGWVNGGYVRRVLSIRWLATNDQDEVTDTMEDWYNNNATTEAARLVVVDAGILDLVDAGWRYQVPPLSDRLTRILEQVRNDPLAANRGLSMRQLIARGRMLVHTAPSGAATAQPAAPRIHPNGPLTPVRDLRTQPAPPPVRPTNPARTPLPKFVKDKLREHMMLIKCEDTTQCPICLDDIPIKEIEFQPCGHEFCDTCLARTIDQCGVCRQ